MAVVDNRLAEHPVAVHYDIVGEGPPLVLQHGRLGSGHSWTEAGYVEALAGDRTLILVDARGHGRSDKPHAAEAYGPRDMASDVIAVLDDLGVDRTDFLGYSMGGRIGFAALAHFGDRFNSMLAGGAGPYGPARSAEAEIETADSLAGGMEAYLAAMERMLDIRMPDALREARLANDADALAALARRTATWTPVVDEVAASGVPLLLFGGTEDPIWELIERAAGELPTAELVAVGPFGHGEDLRRPDLVLPLVSDFLGRVGLAADRRA